MTAVLDDLSATVERLIEICQRSQRGFKAAAEAAQSEELKKLLNLYSNQRTRFAAELRSQFQLAAEAQPVTVDNGRDVFTESSDEDILEKCLEFDCNCLEAYASALRGRIRGRAGFLITAQYSLMQQVHARMRSLAAKGGEPRVTTIANVL